MPALTNAQKQAAFRKAQAERGLRQVNVWVPIKDAEQIKALAAKLCADHDSPHVTIIVTPT